MMSDSCGSVDSDSEEETLGAAAPPTARTGVSYQYLKGAQAQGAASPRATLAGNAGRQPTRGSHGQHLGSEPTRPLQTQAVGHLRADFAGSANKPGSSSHTQATIRAPQADKKVNALGSDVGKDVHSLRGSTEKSQHFGAGSGGVKQGRGRGGGNKNNNNFNSFQQKRMLSQKGVEHTNQQNLPVNRNMRDTSHHHPTHKPGISSGSSSIPSKIKAWTQQPITTVLVHEVSSAVDNLSCYLKTTADIPPDTVSGLISVLHQAVWANQTKAVKRILHCVLESYLLDGHFILFLDQQLKSGTLRSDTLQRLHQVLDVVHYVIEKLPQYNTKCNFSLQQMVDKGHKLGILEPGSKLMLQARMLLNSSIPNQFHEDEARSQFLPDQSKTEQRRIVPAADHETPPDDYSTMTIFPDTAEIFDPVEPFLRANKTKGAYRDLRHYLDIHSRLLKEDYLEPIRQGLKDFTQARTEGKHVKEDNLRFYYDVKLIKMQCDNRGITHFALFSLENLQDIEWEFSKRLKYGALVVLSKDLFETTIFATISDRDTQKLEKGQVELSFHTNLEQVFTSSEFDVFIMAETTAYFESYRHVLEGMQEMNHLPLGRYILSCKRDIHPPDYFKENPFVDLSCIASRGRSLAPIQVLEKEDWPEEDSTNLNESQLEAVRLAMTKEVAIIQGPPGTGKTYVGLRIMQILFQHARRTKRDRRSPILVVCYTNHALDQFLEGILGFCKDGIVRVGGQSSSEALKDFNLVQLRRNPNIEKRVKWQILENLKKCRQSLKIVSRYIDNYWQQSLRQETSILSLSDLQEEIETAHQESLEDPRRQSDLINLDIISVWLGAANANMENHMHKAAERHLSKVIASGDGGISDSGLTSTLAAARADFSTRVQIYRYWAGILKMRLESDIDRLVSISLSGEDALNQLLEEQGAVNETIMPDEKIIPLMESAQVFESIKECVGRESKGFDCSNGTVVRQWLLGQFRAVDLLLDAIERLARPGAKANGKPNRKRPDIEDFDEDTGYQGPGKSWVLAESSDEDNDYDDDDDDISSAASSDDFGDINEIDHDEIELKSQRAEFRDIQREFEQFRNREIQIYQRAQMLGVDMSDTSLEDEEEEEEWQTGKAMSHSKVFKQLSRVAPFSENEAANIKDVWNLEMRDRYRLYKYWVLQRKKKLTDRLIDLTREYRSILAQKKKAAELKDVRILRSARVIGMTTSGAAKYRSVLQKVGSKTVVVEEAAEVLEAHIVTALNAEVQHLILIGDHQQLRPNPTVYRLAKDYDLEISLFERLVNNGLPCVTLNEQHRMRPEIAHFVRHIYPALHDHKSVENYENIEGVASNVFFLQHSFQETEVDDTTSKANIHEAQFLTALCKYFLQHGYTASQISVLAAYGGQVAAIREAMELETEESEYENVRVTSIDNYQGEENDIILLSLVRSNKENNVGFLKTDNRVCVALSRAKKGLFVIGNIKQLAYKSPLWKRILDTAKTNRVTGSDLKLQCVNHKNHFTFVNCQVDFQRDVPEGGCSRPCGEELNCGHTCELMCHSWDRYHLDIICKQPCLRRCPEGHPCPQICAEECSPCEVPVERDMLHCHHKDTVPCHKDLSEYFCSKPCMKMLPCGHECQGRCGKCLADDKHLACTKSVEKTWPLCGHKNFVECHKNPAVEPCTTKCNETLQCGHKCSKGTCGECLMGRVHKPCTYECKKPLPCGHPCKSPCGGICMPCNRPCPTRCRHGPCSRQYCGELCQPCLENCAMTCTHSLCPRRCLDECFSVPCNKLCGKPVEKCKHKCVSLCGEICVCFHHGKDKLVLIDTNNARKNQPKLLVAQEQKERLKKFTLTPEDILMKIPNCGHVFTLKHLDRHVESQNSDGGSSYIRCPNCPAPIQGIRRYNTVINQRADRRHARKEKLIEDTKVSYAEVSQLRASLAKVGTYCNIDEAAYLNREDVLQNIDPNDVISFRARIRFAYALRKIDKMDKQFNKGSAFNPSKWRQCVHSAKKSISDQFWEEMRLELHRLLLSQQLVILNSSLKDCYMNLEKDTKAVISELKAALKNKMKQHDLKICQSMVEKLYQKFLEREEDDHWRKTAERIRSKALRICACLDASKDQDLSFILEQSPCDDTSSSSEDESGTDEETSDEEESSVEEESRNVWTS